MVQILARERKKRWDVNLDVREPAQIVPGGDSDNKGGPPASGGRDWEKKGLGQVGQGEKSRRFLFHQNFLKVTVMRGGEGEAPKKERSL